MSPGALSRGERGFGPRLSGRQVPQGCKKPPPTGARKAPGPPVPTSAGPPRAHRSPQLPILFHQEHEGIFVLGHLSIRIARQREERSALFLCVTPPMPTDNTPDRDPAGSTAASPHLSSVPRCPGPTALAACPPGEVGVAGAHGRANEKVGGGAWALGGAGHPGCGSSLTEAGACTRHWGGAVCPHGRPATRAPAPAIHPAPCTSLQRASEPAAAALCPRTGSLTLSSGWWPCTPTA